MTTIPDKQPRLGARYTQEATRRSDMDNNICSGKRRQAFTSQLECLANELEGCCVDSPDERDLSPGASGEEWTRVLSAATFGRRILVPDDQQINVEEIMRINKLYGAEKDFLDFLHHHTITKCLSDEDGDENDTDFQIEFEKATDVTENFQAIYARVREVTDRMTEGDSLVPFPTQMDASLRTTVVDDHLLESFWRVCQAPNAAELRMVSVACEMWESEVEDWFCEKMSRKGSYFYTKAQGSNKADIVSSPRKRKHSMGQDDDFEGPDQEPSAVPAECIV